MLVMAFKRHFTTFVQPWLREVRLSRQDSGLGFIVFETLIVIVVQSSVSKHLKL